MCGCLSLHRNEIVGEAPQSHVLRNQAWGGPHQERFPSTCGAEGPLDVPRAGDCAGMFEGAKLVGGLGKAGTLQKSWRQSPPLTTLLPKGRVLPVRVDAWDPRRSWPRGPRL